MKKAISLFFAILMSMLCFAAPVYASSNESSQFTTASTTRDNNVPTSTLDLSTYGTYEFSGYAQSNYPLYSLYNFTGKDSYRVIVNNLGQNHTITVKLIKNILLFDYSVYSFNVTPGHSADVTINDLSSGSKYYLEFSAPCYFEGSIS